MAQDDYWYEIHLSNKQLVFYFMAAATGLILSFLAGVMVGRGVDDGAGAAVAGGRTPRQEERVVTEEPVRPAPPAAEDLTYAQRLESERADDSLQKQPATPRPSPVVVTRATPAAPPSLRPTAAPTPAVAARATPRPSAPAPAAGGSFAIQVGAFKDRASADSVMSRLKGKGFAAYVVAPAGGEGLFNVRVGSFPSRGDAEQVQARLRDQERLQAFIVRN